MIEVIGAHAGGPIIRGMTLLTTNEIAGLFGYFKQCNLKPDGCDNTRSLMVFSLFQQILRTVHHQQQPCTINCLSCSLGMLSYTSAMDMLERGAIMPDTGGMDVR